jgi:hypothetical protein
VKVFIKTIRPSKLYPSRWLVKGIAVILNFKYLFLAILQWNTEDRLRRRAEEEDDARSSRGLGGRFYTRGRGTW